jgi:hypothetical protein
MNWPEEELFPKAGLASVLPHTPYLEEKFYYQFLLYVYLFAFKDQSIINNEIFLPQIKIKTDQKCLLLECISE